MPIDRIESNLQKNLLVLKTAFVRSFLQSIQIIAVNLIENTLVISVKEFSIFSKDGCLTTLYYSMRIHNSGFEVLFTKKKITTLAFVQSMFVKAMLNILYSKSLSYADGDKTFKLLFFI